MSPITISLVVFACVVVGVLLGMRGHSLLPDDHRSPETKEVVRLGMAVVGTMVALVLGLLVGSGKGYYDTQSSEVTQLAADLVLQDKILHHYGPETKEIREILRGSVAAMVEATWAKDGSDKTHSTPFGANSESLFDKIQELSPQNDRQRFLQSQALSMAIKIGQNTIANVRTEVLICSYAVGRHAGPLAHLALRKLWTIRSAQRDSADQPGGFCAGGLRRDLPDPRNVPALYRIDSRV